MLNKVNYEKKKTDLSVILIVIHTSTCLYSWTNRKRMVEHSRDWLSEKCRPAVGDRHRKKRKKKKKEKKINPPPDPPAEPTLTNIEYIYVYMHIYVYIS